MYVTAEVPGFSLPLLVYARLGLLTPECPALEPSMGVGSNRLARMTSASRACSHDRKECDGDSCVCM